MEGSNLFWSSGTWVFFLAQGLVVVLAVFLHWYLGKKEKEASGHEKNRVN